jgi:hypothetical protein
VGLTGNAEFPQIGLRKPPWWDNRAMDLAVPTGRGGMTDRQKLVYTAKLARRDFIETAKWADVHYHSGGGTYVKLIEEARKESPDRAKMEKYIRDLEYLRFMIDATEASAVEVEKMTD